MRSMHGVLFLHNTTSYVGVLKAFPCRQSFRVLPVDILSPRMAPLAPMHTGTNLNARRPA